MKILHIAAFEGNIGDNASHLGFKFILDDLLSNYTIDRLEIRKAYKNYLAEDKLRFDDNFATLANTYDLIVFGGGGFLDYWVEDSSNGTTIDIKIDILEKIKTKILITSVGSNPHRKVPIENYNKFKRFLDYVRSVENITIAFRNDGSVESIKQDFGEKYLEGIVEILDHGYFYKPKKLSTLPIEGKYVAINITDDQLNMQGGLEDERDWYYQELESVVQSLAEIGYKTVFVPHIHQDIEAIGTALSKMSAKLVRSNTIVAPCLQSDDGTDFSFGIYKNAKYVIASRYHANVCSIHFGVPTIGLSPLHRIEYTHKQLLDESTCIKIQSGFSTDIINLINNFKEDVDVVNNKLLEDKKKITIDFYKKQLTDLV